MTLSLHRSGRRAAARRWAPAALALSLCAIFFCATLFCATLSFAAASLSGTVTNRTTGKPAAGDEVVLLKLGQGMEEGGRTKADASGKFSFDLDDPGSPHLIRAIHQGVTYHHMAPPGQNSVEVDVYDVAKKVDSIAVTADVMRFQAQDNQLEGIRLFAVDNKSTPPRTQMNDQNFEFYLPEGAVIDTGLAKTAGGQPINSSPVPEKEKNRFTFMFPLRPGETQFQVVFHLPYKGEANIDPKALYPAQHFVVMLPKSMQFTANSGAQAGFQSMADPQNADAQVQVASNTVAGQPLSFKISGTGVLPTEGGGGGGAPAANAGGRDNRPGGGLGPPIDAPDPLEKFRWYILGGFALVLVVGAIYIATRTKSAPVPDYVASDVEIKPRAIPAPRTESAPASSDVLLSAIKEELFQLELDRKQGRITQAEYEQAKAGLDRTLERALKRDPQKV